MLTVGQRDSQGLGFTRNPKYVDALNFVSFMSKVHKKL